MVITMTSNGLDQDGTPMPEWKTYSKEEPNQMLFFDEVKPTTEITKQTQFLLDINDYLLHSKEARYENEHGGKSELGNNARSL